MTVLCMFFPQVQNFYCKAFTVQLKLCWCTDTLEDIHHNAHCISISISNFLIWHICVVLYLFMGNRKA